MACGIVPDASHMPGRIQGAPQDSRDASSGAPSGGISVFEGCECGQGTGGSVGLAPCSLNLWRASNNGRMLRIYGVERCIKRGKI